MKPPLAADLPHPQSEAAQYPERTFPTDGPCQIGHPHQGSLLCTLAVGHGGQHVCNGIAWAPLVVPRSAPWGEGADSGGRDSTQVCPNCRQLTLDVHEAPMPEWMNSPSGRRPPERVECTADCGVTREQLRRAGLETLDALLKPLPGRPPPTARRKGSPRVLRGREHVVRC